MKKYSYNGSLTFKSQRVEYQSRLLHNYQYSKCQLNSYNHSYVTADWSRELKGELMNTFDQVHPKITESVFRLSELVQTWTKSVYFISLFLKYSQF